MDVLENAQKILDYIGDRAGVENLEFDGAGRAILERGGKTFIFLAREDDPILVALIYLGQPDLKDSSLLADILAGNHFGVKTGGGSLSIDEETGHLCLYHHLDLPCENPADAEAFLGGLLGAAGYWQGVLAGREDKHMETASGWNSDFIRV